MSISPTLGPGAILGRHGRVVAAGDQTLTVFSVAGYQKAFLVLSGSALVALVSSFALRETMEPPAGD